MLAAFKSHPSAKNAEGWGSLGFSNISQAAPFIDLIVSPT